MKKTCLVFVVFFSLSSFAANRNAFADDGAGLRVRGGQTDKSVVLAWWEGGTVATREKVRIGNYFQLSPLVVNLASDDGLRYLKVSMNVEFTRSEMIGEATGKIYQIKDVIITVLSSKPAEEMLTIDGKCRLKEQLISSLNRLLMDSHAVKNLFFTEFVIQ